MHRISNKPTFARGVYRVMRWCCVSGCCIECRAAFDLRKRKRVVHTDHVSQAWAEYVAANWQMLGAKVERMRARTRP